MVASRAEACAACGAVQGQDLERQVKVALEQAHKWKHEATELQVRSLRDVRGTGGGCRAHPRARVCAQDLLAESESTVRSWQQHALAASKVRTRGLVDAPAPRVCTPSLTPGGASVARERACRRRQNTGIGSNSWKAARPRAVSWRSASISDLNTRSTPHGPESASAWRVSA